MPCSIGWERSISRAIAALRLSRLLPILPEALQDLDLSRVVDVVRRDAVDERVRPMLAAGRLRSERPVGEFRHGRPEPLVHVVEESDVRAPGALGRRRGSGEPVASLLAERSPLLAGEHAPDGVLPVRGVERELPDVVPPGSRPPGGLAGADAAQRAFQVRPLPGLLL